MPSHRKPKSLVSLSLLRLCQHLDWTCRRLQMLSQKTSSAHVLVYAKMDIRPYYIKALPTSLRCEVIEETSKMLSAPSSDGSTLISGPAPLYLLTLLLGHDIKQLKVNLCCYYGCSHQTSLLKLLASEGIGLECLELARSALLRLDFKLLRPALLNMKNLVSLTLRNIASDVVLEIIGKSCPKLVVLDVSSSRQVTDVGLRLLLLEVEFKDKVTNIPAQEPTSWSKLKTILSKIKSRRSKPHKRNNQGVLLECSESRNLICDTLKVLNIANTSVTSSGVLLALLSISHLESLEDYNHMERVIEMMDKHLLQTETPLSLTQARSCRTTSARLELLAMACPKVEKLHISEPHHPPASLKFFSCITSLSIHSIPMQREWLIGFYDYLRTNGSKLKELNLHIIKNELLLTLDLKEIFINCPNLRVMMKDCYRVVWSEGPDPPPLKYLRKVRLGHSVHASVVSKILSLSPELRALHIYICYGLTDEHFNTLLTTPTNFGSDKSTDRMNNNIVKNLTCLYIYDANGDNNQYKVLATTVLKILQNCKRLRKIGSLANWGLNCEGMEILRRTLENANIDVNLYPGSHWFWNKCI